MGSMRTKDVLDWIKWVEYLLCRARLGRAPYPEITIRHRMRLGEELMMLGYEVIAEGTWSWQ